MRKELNMPGKKIISKKFDKSLLKKKINNFPGIN